MTDVGQDLQREHLVLSTSSHTPRQFTARHCAVLLQLVVRRVCLAMRHASWWPTAS
jgi:hypothetical protein